MYFRKEIFLHTPLTSEEFKIQIVSLFSAFLQSKSPYIDMKMLRSLKIQVGSCSLQSSFGYHEATPVLCVLEKTTRARLENEDVREFCQYRIREDVHISFRQLDCSVV